MPMILATSAVHSWLTRKGPAHLLFAERAFGGMRIDPHYFAVLIGCGATTVNPIWRRTPSPNGSGRAC